MHRIKIYFVVLIQQTLSNFIKFMGGLHGNLFYIIYPYIIL